VSLHAPSAIARTAACIALCVALGSCALVLGLDPLKISDWHPRDIRLSAAAVGGIWVEFSGDVDRTKAEQAFSLSENSTPMTGSFSWSNNRLLFTPARPVGDGNDYEIAVLSTAETEGGNSLARDFRFAFTTKSESTRPSVTSVQPSDGSRVAPPQLPVVIVFSEPVDRTSFMAAWSVSPDPGGVISFDATGSTATFTPLATWQLGTEYSVTVSDSLTDTSGNHLASALKTRFTAGADGTRPTLVTIRQTLNGAPLGGGMTPEDPTDATLQVNMGFEAVWGLELEFDKDVQRENIESFIDIEPAWGFTIDPSSVARKRFALIPRERFRWGGLYGVTIKHGILDTSGNSVAADATYFLRVDGTATRPPSVQLLRFRTNPADLGAPSHAQYAPTDAFGNLDLSLFGPTESVSYFDVYFGLAAGASIDPFSLMRSFTVTATNGAAIITPIAVAISSFSDPPPPLVAGLTPARVSVMVSSTTNSGVVTIGVSEGLTDSAGNTMSAAFSLPLLK
jgi:hypothetical protein